MVMLGYTACDYRGVCDFMASINQKKSDFKNIKYNYQSARTAAGENLSTGGRHLHRLVLVEGWACGKDKEYQHRRKGKVYIMMEGFDFYCSC